MVITATLRKAVTLDGSPVHGREPDELRKMLDSGTLTEQRLDMMLRPAPTVTASAPNPAASPSPGCAPSTRTASTSAPSSRGWTR